MLGVSLERARAHPAGIEVVLAEAANVDRPEIEGWLAFGDPLGERHAGPAAGRDAEGVEAGADKDAAHLGGLAEDEVAIGREAFRPVDELLDAGSLHGRHTTGGEFEERLEVLQVVVKKLELEALGKAVHGPRLGIGLIAAHDETAHLLLPIGETVRIAQRRQARRHARRFCR